MKMKDDRELVMIAAKEPEKGFRCLMAKYKDAVYWHIRRLVVVHEDAQDATQETFVGYSGRCPILRANVLSDLGYTGLPPTKPCVF